jgi:Dolichyl-phosphate-mannose-protein mannosyltransferase
MRPPARASIAKGGAVAVAVVGLSLLVVPYFAPSSDAYNALAWGDTLADGETPDFDAGPVKHPLQIAVAAALSPLGADGALDLYRLLSVLAFVGLLYATYRVGRALFSPAIGLAAAGLVLTRPDVILFATSCDREVPLTALVLLALALAIEDTERHWPAAMALLAAAGLLRPEAWALSLLYAAWLLIGPSKRAGLEARRGAVVAMALIAPVAWALFDLALTGDPLDTYRSLTTGGDAPGETGGFGTVGGGGDGRIPIDIYLSVLRRGIPGVIGWPLAALGTAAAGYALWRNRHGRGEPPDPLLAVVFMVGTLLAVYVVLAVADAVAAPRFLLTAAVGLVILATALLVLPRTRALAIVLVAAGVAIAVALPGDLEEAVDTLDLQSTRNDRDADLADLASRPDVQAAARSCHGLYFVSDLRSFANRGGALVAPRLGLDPGEIALRRRVRLKRGEAAFSAGVRPPAGKRLASDGIWTFVSRCGGSGARSES